ncbi:hypothetical protein QJQ45_012862 [Haematococcus lacustris]|nr:hypothetical protein QJQ45_012862 [Haematococcus lacustris]
MPTASKGLHGLDAHQPLPSVQLARLLSMDAAFFFKRVLVGQAAEHHAAAGRRGLTSWSAVYATKSDGGGLRRRIINELRRGHSAAKHSHRVKKRTKARQGSGAIMFRTSRVSSARTNVVQGQAESFRWLHPARSIATRSRIRGLMCSTSNGIRFYDRDVSAAQHPPHCSRAGPPSRAQQLARPPRHA